MNKTFLVYITLLFLNSIHSAYDPIIISIPKAGTHLLCNCIAELTHKKFTGFVLFPPENQNDNKKFCYAHIKYSSEYAQKIKNKNCKTFFIYRDPRDQIVSTAFYNYDRPDLWPHWQKLKLSELITELIIDGKSMYNGFPPYDVTGINEFYRAYMGWLKLPWVYSIKFEDLVGSSGGSTQEEQYKKIQEIAHHLSLKLPSATIPEIAQALFGNSATFREGKIGAWKKYFTEEHKALFKSQAGQLLIDLGYEKDLNW
jgi:sulfotransferase 6B1